jgi:hypothetical protein
MTMRLKQKSQNRQALWYMDPKIISSQAAFEGQKHVHTAVCTRIKPRG